MSLRCLLCFAIVVCAGFGQANQDEPRINANYPARVSENLSPPIVRPPIYECAMAVYVYGFVPRATVRVIANGVETVGAMSPLDGFGEIALSRPLALGESITATQTVGSVTSGQSYDPVVVGTAPALTTPVAGPDVYACGRVVPVNNLVASTHVEVSDLDASTLIGTGESTGSWEPIVTSSLVEAHHVRAVQISCPDRPDHRLTSLPSAPITVKPQPVPFTAPAIDPPPVGAETVTLHGLFVGAEIEIRNGTTVIGGGLATAPDNWSHVTAIPPSASITATQKLCSSSPPSIPVQPTTSIPAPILGAPICEGSHYVSIDKTIVGAYVVVLRAGSIIGYGGGMLGTLTLAIGSGVTLHAGDVLEVVEYVGSIFSSSNTVVVGCGGGANVVTQHNDNFRTGVYGGETSLTVALVLARGMRVKYRHPIDGAMAAQPLYVRRVAFDRGAANGLFVATQNNKVYGIASDTGDEKWVVTLSDSDPGRRGLARGVLTTPAIDVSTNRMYVLFSTKNQAQDAANCPDSGHPDPNCGTYEDQLNALDVAYWLVALDIRNGHEVGRARVAARLYRSDGTPVTFTAKNQVDRPAILLDHGSVNIGFGMRFREEIIEYHGWVLRYRASDLSLESAFCTSRNSTVPTAPFTGHIAEGAGIWQGGGGLASDPDGNIYALTGNAKADATNYSFGDMILKLSPSGGTIVPATFVPSDPDTLEANDVDVGSGGPMTIPGTNRVIGGGKSGYMYLLDRTTMALSQRITASTNQYDPTLREQSWDAGPHLHGSPTYWRGPDPRFGNLYVWGEKDVLRQYRFDTTTGMIVEPAVRQGTVRALSDTMPGGMISVSANGNSSGTGIVWATLPDTNTVAPGANAYPGRVYAFNAETLEPLWDTAFSSMGKWLEPTIADAHVYVGTSSNEVIAYELGPAGTRTQWTVTMPHEAPHAMHLSERFPDEESLRALPASALVQVAPPRQHTRFHVLVGEGENVYEAAAGTNGKLQWTLAHGSGNLRVVDLPAQGSREKRVRVEFHQGATRLSGDGGKAKAAEERLFPAPEKSAESWALYRVTEKSGRGVLAQSAYIQRIFTEGGAAPATAPEHQHSHARIRWHAQYALYQ